MRAALLVVALALPAAAHATPTAPETRAPSGPSWKTATSLGVVTTSAAAGWALVSAAWWTRDDASGRLHFRDEGAFGLETYAGGADKLGHFYANYVGTRLYGEFLEWGGFSRRTAVASSLLLVATFFTAIELKDGFQRSYGFAWGDVVSNLAGQGAALGFGLVPALDEALSIKLAYLPSREFRRGDPDRSSLNVAEDYSGQTYLLAFHLAALPFATASSTTGALRYVDVSVGYETRGYQPLPAVPVPVRQLASLGLSFNLQRALDELLAPHEAAASVVHFTTEVLEPPFLRVPVLTSRREGPAARAH
jgi:hypothetical protein